LLANAIRGTPPNSKKKAKWKPIFWPDEFKKTKASLKLADNQLT